MRWLSVAVFVLVSVMGFACSGAGASGPPEIQYGRDVCAECHMIISEARYAAAYRDASGEPFVFDDVDDMVTHAVRAGVLGDMTAWVHDYDKGRWLDAPKAWFVRSGTLETPMGGGIVAFARRGTAESFAADHDGEVLSWSSLLDAVRQGDSAATSTTTSSTTEREDQ